MSFRINSGITAMNANIHSNLNNLGVNKSLASLASGSALNSAAYDASGLGIANQFSAQVSGLGRAIMNTNDTIGLIQVADGAMQEYGNILEDVQRLTLQASNGTLNDSDRAYIQKEIDGLLETADYIAKSTSFNDIKLLDGTGGSTANGTFISQIGADAGDSHTLTIDDAQVSALIPGGIDVTTQAAAQSSISSTDTAIDSVNNILANLGASQNALSANVDNISVSQINAAAAESQIRDIDFAAESANFSKLNILSQTGIFASAQANAAQANVASLFN